MIVTEKSQYKILQLAYNKCCMIGSQVRVISTELELVVVMGSLSRLDMTVASQVYLPASEKVRKVKERVSIV